MTKGIAEAPAPPEDPVEKLAEKAHDLDAVRKSVEDAASISGGLWLSYLFTLFYIAIAAGAVTHKDLLLENPVKLPFLNVELPLIAFFFLAPILFVIVHAYTLTHFVMLAAKAGNYRKELEDQLKGDDWHEAREGHRRQLPSNIFVQFLVGPKDIREGGLGFLLRVVAWMSLVIGPVLLLLLIQIQFLPYHLEWVTWVQRAAVFTDLILLWFMWPAVLNSRSRLKWRLERKGRGWPSAFTLAGRYAAALFACSLTLAFSVIVARFPGEWLNEQIGQTQWIPPNPVTTWLGATHQTGEPKAASFHELLFHGAIDTATRRRKSLFSNTLVLPGFDALEAKTIDDQKKLDWTKHTLNLRGRHLEGAVLSGADLRKADFEGAWLQSAFLVNIRLQGASLFGAQLQRAALDHAQLQRAALNWAQLQRASLYSAQLQGASLEWAQLQGASLDHAQLQRAALDHAQLQRASLYSAQLQRASLYSAQLQGASLNSAQLQRASLKWAQLQGASLKWAQLQGAALYSAQLQGAALYSAQLQGAALVGAQLQGAALVGAQLQGAALNSAQLQGAALYSAQLQGAALVGAELQGAALVGAQLQGAALVGAQLQGANFDRATLKATNFDRAKIWRANFKNGTDKETVFFDNLSSLAKEAEEFEDMRRKISAQVLDGQARERVLDRIAILNPAIFGPEVSAPKTLEEAKAKKTVYEKDLAEELRALACSGGESAQYIVHGLIHERRLEGVGPHALQLARDMLALSCPVSSSLLPDDRAALEEIGQQRKAVAAPQP